MADESMENYAIRKPVRKFIENNKRAQSVLSSHHDILNDNTGSSTIEAITSIRTSIETFQ